MCVGHSMATAAITLFGTLRSGRAIICLGAALKFSFFQQGGGCDGVSCLGGFFNGQYFYYPVARFGGRAVHEPWPGLWRAPDDGNHLWAAAGLDSYLIDSGWRCWCGAYRIRTCFYRSQSARGLLFNLSGLVPVAQRGQCAGCGPSAGPGAPALAAAGVDGVFDQRHQPQRHHLHGGRAAAIH